MGDLLKFSAVCGCGLDTVPISGEADPKALGALLLDVAALAFRRGGSPVHRAFFLSALFYALHWSAFPGGGPLHTAFVMALTALAPASTNSSASRPVRMPPMPRIGTSGNAACTW